MHLPFPPHRTFYEENPLQTLPLLVPFLLALFIDWHGQATQVASPKSSADILGLLMGLKQTLPAAAG